MEPGCSRAVEVFSMLLNNKEFKRHFSILPQTAQDWIGHSHFFFPQSLNPSPVSSFKSAISSGSGTLLKLKQALPCMHFFSRGEMLFRSSGHMYKGTRWKLTYALPRRADPK